jgi:hypothetical protein
MAGESGPITPERLTRADIRFHCGDALTVTASELRGPYDLIYDSGCDTQ